MRSGDRAARARRRGMDHGPESFDREVLRSFPRSANEFARDGSLGIGWEGALWSLRTGKDESPHRPPRDNDWTPRALSPDGRLVLLSCISQNAGPVGLWEPALGSKVTRLSGHAAIVSTGAFTEDGKRVITGSGEKNRGRQDCSVRIWDASSTREVATLRDHDAGVRAVATSANGRRVVWVTALAA